MCEKCGVEPKKLGVNREYVLLWDESGFTALAQTRRRRADNLFCSQSGGVAQEFSERRLAGRRSRRWLCMDVSVERYNTRELICTRCVRDVDSLLQITRAEATVGFQRLTQPAVWQ